MVPSNELRSEVKRRYVQVYNPQNCEIRDVNVKVGLTGDDKVEIISSELKAGDQVLVKAAKPTQTNRRMGPPM